MSLSCIIFGAIGALVETSDIQRRSFNQAFKKKGLDWDWSVETYKDLLKINGGQNRIRHYAERTDTALSDADIAALHQAKTDAYEVIIKDHGLTARAGIAELITHAKQTNIVVGMASTTSPQNIDALFEAATDLSKSDFDFILSGEDVDTIKPDPAIYALAARRSQRLTSEILVIEDTPVSAQSGQEAGLAVVLYPGDMISSDDGDFPTVTSDQLSLNNLLDVLNRIHGKESDQKRTG